MKKQTYTRDEIIDILIDERNQIDYEISVCEYRNDFAGMMSRKSMRTELNTLLERF